MGLIVLVDGRHVSNALCKSLLEHVGVSCTLLYLIVTYMYIAYTYFIHICILSVMFTLIIWVKNTNDINTHMFTRQDVLYCCIVGIDGSSLLVASYPVWLTF